MRFINGLQWFRCVKNTIEIMSEILLILKNPVPLQGPGKVFGLPQINRNPLKDYS